MNSNRNKNLYDYLLLKTKGNLTKHTITYELQNVDEQISLHTDEIIGCPLVTTSPEELENGNVLLAGEPRHFCNQTILLNRLTAIDSENITFTTFKHEGQEYYCSSEDGMYLQAYCIPLKQLSIAVSQPLYQQRLDKVKEYFNRQREKHGMELSDNQIYKLIGEPTKKALWNEWYRLYPDVFIKKFQQKFFDEHTFPKITFKEGNDPKRATIAEEHKL